jgi:hypothetical protein
MASGAMEATMAYDNICSSGAALFPLALPILFIAHAIALPAYPRPKPQASGPSGYHLLKKVTLGGAGGWDYLEVDPSSHRVFISRGTHVTVFDPAQEKIVGDILDTNGVHGVAIAGDLNRGFTSNGRAASSTIFDLTSLKMIGSVTTDRGPDGIIYDPFAQRAFTFNGNSRSATAIDASSGSVAGTVALGGDPEFAATDRKGSIFVNLEDKSSLVKFGAKDLQVKQTWPLAPCESPSGLAIDANHEILVVGCRNKLMAFVDGNSGSVLGTVPIGQGVDANRFDPATGYAFASCGDGTLTIAHGGFPNAIFAGRDNPDATGRAHHGPRLRHSHRVSLHRRLWSGSGADRRKSTPAPRDPSGLGGIAHLRKIIRKGGP